MGKENHRCDVVQRLKSIGEKLRLFKINRRIIPISGTSYSTEVYVRSSLNTSKI